MAMIDYEVLEGVMADTYQFQVVGRINNRWSDWLGGLVVQQQEDGTTMLIGQVADQAALHGVFHRMRDLGLPILSVQYIGPNVKGVQK